MAALVPQQSVVAAATAAASVAVASGVSPALAGRLVGRAICDIWSPANVSPSYFSIDDQSWVPSGSVDICPPSPLSAAARPFVPAVELRVASLETALRFVLEHLRLDWPCRERSPPSPCGSALSSGNACSLAGLVAADLARLNAETLELDTYLPSVDALAIFVPANATAAEPSLQTQSSRGSRKNRKRQSRRSSSVTTGQSMAESCSCQQSGDVDLATDGFCDETEIVADVPQMPCSDVFESGNTVGSHVQENCGEGDVVASCLHDGDGDKRLQLQQPCVSQDCDGTAGGLQYHAIATEMLPYLSVTPCLFGAIVCSRQEFDVEDPFSDACRDETGIDVGLGADAAVGGQKSPHLVQQVMHDDAVHVAACNLFNRLCWSDAHSTDDAASSSELLVTEVKSELFSSVTEASAEQFAGLKGFLAMLVKNGHSMITTEELGTALRSFGLKPTEFELHGMVNEVVADENGNIVFPEIFSVMARQLLDASTYEAVKEVSAAFDSAPNDEVRLAQHDETMTHLTKAVRPAAVQRSRPLRRRSWLAASRQRELSRPSRLRGEVGEHRGNSSFIFLLPLRGRSAFAFVPVRSAVEYAR
eukprot:TRINITY_DN4723_c0_g1_i5.p1 TRINITY_DN4723_c0_g1~~TRINITY_DN4723_c0_g1_i5.p1  ORF type:complete len:637 (+),score=95.63 TRINITY_DN4723_c0_g1_i5:144-1913(+)